jgi:methionine aminopeptidase type I
MPITIKSPEEQEKMRVAGRLAADVLDMITPHVVPGITTNELDDLCHQFIVQTQKAIPANVGYNGFPKTICTSVNHVVCHGIPNDKKLRSGDIVNIDVTVIRDGFHGDTSRMYFAGKPAVLGERLSRVTHDAMWAAIRIVRPGTRLGDIGHVIQQLRGARVLRPWHWPDLPRRAPGAALRATGHGHRAARRHDVHHRAHDQCRQAPCETAAG